VNDGGPAFPLGYNTKPKDEPGMSLRDYFAAAASEAAVSHFIRKAIEVFETNDPDDWCQPAYGVWHMEKIAAIEARYRNALADAMLAEREKESKP
jgi:hypothetical protein